jgi:MFS family permease
MVLAAAHRMMADDLERDSDETSRVRLILRAFRHRNYRLFFAGQIVSLVGTWMQSVAQSWLIYQLTGSATLLGLTSFFGQLPVFLLAPIGGVVADAADRRKILLATQAVSMVLALTLAGITFAGVVEVWHVFALAGVMGLANAFDIPARQSFVVEMVGREDLSNAIALNSSMFNGARIVGPAVAGLLVAAVGEAWCFFANGVSYIAVIAGLLMIRVAPREVAPARGSAFKRIGEGFGYVARTGPIRGLLLLLGLVSLVGMPYAVLMPIFADSILGGGAQGLGILMGASGVGALAAALTLAGRNSVRGLGRWVAYSSMGFGICLVLFSLSRSFWLSVAILVPTGFSVMLQMASSNTLVQAMVPDELRGRVMSVYSMMFMGMAPLGAFFAGAIAERIGAPTTIVIGAVACMIGAVVFLLRLPALRPEAHRLLVAQESMGGVPTSKLTASGVR